MIVAPTIVLTLALGLTIASVAPATAAASDVRVCATATQAGPAACATSSASVSTSTLIPHDHPARGLLAALWFGGGIAVLAAGYAAVDVSVRRDRVSESPRR